MDNYTVSREHEAPSYKFGCIEEMFGYFFHSFVGSFVYLFINYFFGWGGGGGEGGEQTLNFMIHARELGCHDYVALHASDRLTRVNRDVIAKCFQRRMGFGHWSYS